MTDLPGKFVPVPFTQLRLEIRLTRRDSRAREIQRRKSAIVKDLPVGEH